jgi:hypothetical protein|tara:strand:+ start:4521 stop:4784 length:264 start_codon:yes stop_codon:yes gene_type:complete
MPSNKDHPENKLPKSLPSNSKNKFIEDCDVRKLALHVANLTEHTGHLSGLIHALTKELMKQKEAYYDLKQFIIRHIDDGNDDLHFRG